MTIHDNLNKIYSPEKPRRSAPRLYAKVQVFNKTEIEWCTHTWNPVTGCRHGCEYCYARKIAERRIGVYKDIGFAPHLHKQRLTAPGNMSGTGSCFVVSMGDLFGKWVPSAWIQKVIDATAQAPNWTFYFLTKNPERYLEFEFTDNHWLGASAGTQELVDKAEEAFARMNKNRFISCEPLSEQVTIPKCVDWCIIGPQTNPEIQPEWEWIRQIIKTTDIPLFFKPATKFQKWTPTT